MSVGEAEIRNAYRLILGREIDEAGRNAYVARQADGPIGLRVIIDELLSSEEFLQRTREAASTREPGITRESSDTVPPDLVHPSDVIARHSIEELNATAEEYYKRIPDTTPLQAKPFAFWHETPQILHDLGLLLDGLEIGKGMTVLDLGAGTCWLTRILSQLSCRVIAADVSASALDIGRDLFRKFPPLGGDWVEPTFLHFDGIRLGLPDASVDRIICFDAFHHVPNPDAVLAELARVLRPGGRVGMSEPGRHHSRSPQSQYEMKTHAVLENDIDLSRLGPAALKAGFTRVTVTAFGASSVSLEEYLDLTDPNSAFPSAKERVWTDIVATTSERTIFFLSKGEPIRDSRRHEGLAHDIRVEPQSVQMRTGASVRLTCVLKNTGEATWLHETQGFVGTVRVGCHLFTPEIVLLNLDFSRHNLPRSVGPGEELTVSIDVPAPEVGQFVLAVDLVSEGVTWFENVGSRPALVSVAVTPR
jgi:ubiquinone/menaquinone biosynthesis C-methylase UbiE